MKWHSNGYPLSDIQNQHNEKTKEYEECNPLIVFRIPFEKTL